MKLPVTLTLCDTNDVFCLQEHFLTTDSLSSLSTIASTVVINRTLDSPGLVGRVEALLFLLQVSSCSNSFTQSCTVSLKFRILWWSH